jgi:hypothetical protein
MSEVNQFTRLVNWFMSEVNSFRIGEMIFEKSSFGLAGGGFRELGLNKSVRDAGKK